MARAFAIVVRTNYLFACLVALLVGGWVIVGLIQSIARPEPFASSPDIKDFVAALLCIVFVSLPLRAFVRLLRKGELLPDDRLRERPVVGTLVAFAAALGTFLVFNVASGLIQTLPDSADVNFAGPSLLAIMLYAFALATGEVVLVGRIQSIR